MSALLVCGWVYWGYSVVVVVVAVDDDDDDGC